MKSVKVKISQIRPNPDNPRIIRDEQFEKLVKSITEFPQMLEIRPLVVDDDLMILGGNMRLRAAQKAGLKELPVIKASELSEEQKQRFIIADNLSFGEWDWDKLANEWDAEQLGEWGLDVLCDEKVENIYVQEIKTPLYEPKSDAPTFEEMVNTDKTEKFINIINTLELTASEKMFLLLAANRHNVFSYKKIANYYASARPDIQNLMENMGLVIIDYEKSIENGYIELAENIKNQYAKDYE